MKNLFLFLAILMGVSSMAFAKTSSWKNNVLKCTKLKSREYKKKDGS